VDPDAAERLKWLSKVMDYDLQQFGRLFARYYGDGAILQELATHVSELRNQLSAAAQRIDPAKSIYEEDTRRAAIAAFDKLLDVVLKRHDSDLKNGERDAFKSARERQRYFEALRALPADASRLRAPTGDGPKADRPEYHARETRAVEARPPEAAPSLATESVATLKARTFSELAAAEAAQTAIAMVLITGVGYLLFADNFVGTLTDIATIFLWGFTLDISVSKLLEVASPLAAKARES
jgi:hypothetical protein